jgi:hypothetical protein
MLDCPSGPSSGRSRLSHWSRDDHRQCSLNVFPACLRHGSIRVWHAVCMCCVLAFDSSPMTCCPGGLSRSRNAHVATCICQVIISWHNHVAQSTGIVIRVQLVYPTNVHLPIVGVEAFNPRPVDHTWPVTVHVTTHIWPLHCCWHNRVQHMSVHVFHALTVPRSW